MFKLKQLKRVRGSAGEPLPTVFKSFSALGIVFLRGQLVLIAAGAGTGKSLLVLTQILKSRVPAMYFSADSDAFTQLSRSLCVITGCSMTVAQEAVRSGDLSRADEAMEGIPVWFSFDASPTPEQMESDLESYWEIYGQYPHAVIVDNITNVRTGGGDDENPFEGLEGLMDYLHTMSRGTGACVIGLHHVTGPYNDSDKPVPLSGLKQQIGRVPEMVLTLFRVRGTDGLPDLLRVSKVKDRGGRADPSGNLFAELEFEGDRMRISDLSFGL